MKKQEPGVTKSIRIEMEQNKLCQMMADDLGISFSGLVRYALEELVNRQTKKKRGKR